MKLAELDKEEQFETFESIVEGTSTNKHMVGVTPIDNACFASLYQDGIKGDGNCFWRAVGCVVHTPWKRLKHGVLTLARKQGQWKWAQQHARSGTCVDNNGVYLTAQYQDGTINIKGDEQMGSWAVEARQSCTINLKLSHFHYSALMAKGKHLVTDEQCASEEQHHSEQNNVLANDDTIFLQDEFVGGAPKRAEGRRGRSRTPVRNAVDVDLAEEAVESRKRFR